MKKIMLLVLCSLPVLSFGQLPLLSKVQMQQDMDTLVSLVDRYYFSKCLLEKRTGISLKHDFRVLRSRITDKTTQLEFVDIVRQGLNLLNDGHTEMAGKASVKWYLTSSYSYLSRVGNASEGDTLYADRYQRMIQDRIFAQSKSGFRAKYIDGRYYNARPFTFNGVTVEAGEEITSIDGQDVNSFVKENRSRMFSLLWDPYNRRWYSDSFMLIMPFFKKKLLTLEIGGKKVTIDTGKSLENLQRERYSLYSSPKAYCFDDILYLYIPSMMNADWYISQIRQLYTPAIRKVVLDVRGNGGGDDGVWARIIGNLIGKPLTYRFNVGMNPDSGLKKAISSFGDIGALQKRMEVSSTRTIYPDSAGVNFNGMIYVLQDKFTYSAAAALASVSIQCKDRMMLLGERSALISGYTFPALLFSLPNSRIAFKMGFSADLSGGDENYFMDKVDVEYRDSAADCFYKLFKEDAHSLDYLKSKDKLIQMVKAI